MLIHLLKMLVASQESQMVLWERILHYNRRTYPNIREWIYQQRLQKLGMRHFCQHLESRYGQKTTQLDDKDPT